jgi:hypothetical protein
MGDEVILEIQIPYCPLGSPHEDEILFGQNLFRRPGSNPLKRGPNEFPGIRFSATTTPKAPNRLSKGFQQGYPRWVFASIVPREVLPIGEIRKIKS